ncbi:unnamed protein product [Gongylonema pulchrum]|uniref:C2H2-type domain-containing protein n=1 Tax=Gongylonema pulchrum TaxID=637853 RepID=A0A183DW51_9BILA|nr:unnamed protein product [Gongylonema pulchrum]
MSSLSDTAADTIQQHAGQEDGLNLEALLNPEFYCREVDFVIPEMVIDSLCQDGWNIPNPCTPRVPNIQPAPVSNSENFNLATLINAENFLSWNASSLLDQLENELPDELQKSEPKIIAGGIIAEQQRTNSFDPFRTQTVRIPRSDTLSSEVDFEPPNIQTDTNQPMNMMRQQGGCIDNPHTIYLPNIQTVKTSNPEHFNPPNNVENFLLRGGSSLLTHFVNRLPENEFHKSAPVITAGEIIAEQQYTSLSNPYGTQTVRTTRSDTLSSEMDFELPVKKTDTDQQNIEQDNLNSNTVMISSKPMDTEFFLLDFDTPEPPMNTLHEQGRGIAQAIHTPNVQAAETLNPERFSFVTINRRENFLPSESNSPVTQSENHPPEAKLRKKDPDIIVGWIIATPLHTNLVTPYDGQTTKASTLGTIEGLAPQQDSAQEYLMAQYHCSYVSCNTRTSSFQEFKVHLRGHNREGENRCYWLNCGQNFSSPQNLDLHFSDHLMVDYSRPDKHKCTECGQFFCAESLLQLHRKSIHPQGKSRLILMKPSEKKKKTHYPEYHSIVCIYTYVCASMYVSLCMQIIQFWNDKYLTKRDFSLHTN